MVSREKTPRALTRHIDQPLKSAKYGLVGYITTIKNTPIWQKNGPTFDMSPANILVFQKKGTI